MDENKSLVSVERIQNKILLIRGQKVMLDADLSNLYGVKTKVLNQAVKRNIERFPIDFMFQLSEEEKSEVVTNCDRLSSLKYSPFLPYAFTEHGAIMAANVLNTPRAMEVSVYVVRAFIKLRQMLINHKEMAQKLRELETRLDSHDKSIRKLVVAILQLMEPAADKKEKKIGFRTSQEQSKRRKK